LSTLNKILSKLYGSSYSNFVATKLFEVGKNLIWSRLDRRAPESASIAMEIVNSHRVLKKFLESSGKDFEFMQALKQDLTQERAEEYVGYLASADQLFSQKVLFMRDIILTSIEEHKNYSKN